VEIKREIYHEKSYCRLCKSRDLESVLDLGTTHLADEFSYELKSDSQFPLVLNSCKFCGWLQTSIVVDPSRLYQQDYPYDSSTTLTGRLHWNELAQSARNLFPSSRNPKSLDIGANVGALVREFKDVGFEAYGVDPSQSATDVATASGVLVENAFFDLEYAKLMARKGIYFEVITATNVFAHIDDLDAWVMAIILILKEKGVLIVEVPHSLRMIQNNQFDTIYHEHLSYVSLKPLKPFLEKFNLEVIQVQERKIHGGTIRLFISRIGNYIISPSVQEIENMEIEFGLTNSETLENFRSNVSRLISEVRTFIDDCVAEGERICALSAPAKGMTFLNVVGLMHPTLLGISDAAPQKVGKFAPGIGIRVVTDDELALLKPNYVIILAWNFADEILTKVTSKFGKETVFLTAIPELKICSYA
jgi:SAM-dependent methyltransferase